MAPPQRYSFVNARPQTKAEKRRTRTAIRSHIGRWTQEKQQKIDGDTGSARKKNSPPESSRMALLLPAPSQQTLPRFRDRVGSVESDESWDSNGATQLYHDCTASDIDDHAELTPWAPAQLPQGRSVVSAIVSNAFIQILGSGVLDPFQTYPSKFPPSLVSQSHEYCSIESAMARTDPRSINGTDSAASLAWFPMALNDAVALHSLLFGALSHKRLSLIKGSGQLDDSALASLELDMRRSEVEAISLINKALRRADNVITDAIIVSVLVMATNAWDLTFERFQKQSAPLPVFDPLLKSLQWLDVYGLLSVNPIHAAGLVQLINLRGGLRNIQTPGLASTISYSSIINASRNLTPPPFSWIPLVDDGGQTPTLWSLLGTSPKELKDQLIFNGLFDLGLTDGIALVLVAMRRYEQSVQLFVDGALPDLDLARLCDQRNLVHHTLLSLPSQKDLPTIPRPRPIYEPTRLAMLIYSLTVIFPLPPQTAPIATLTGQLKSALREADMRSSWSSSHQAQRLLIWILVVGGVAARDVPEDRSWFLAALSRLTTQNGIRKFEHLKKDVLNRFLWLDRACDAAGGLLWADILDQGIDKRRW